MGTSLEPAAGLSHTFGGLDDWAPVCKLTKDPYRPPVHSRRGLSGSRCSIYAGEVGDLWDPISIYCCGSPNSDHWESIQLPERLHHRLSSAADMQLLIHAVEVSSYGLDPQFQFVGDLLVEVSLGEQA